MNHSGDYVQDQMCIKECIDPFTGEPVKEGERKAPLGASREICAVGRLFGEPIGSAKGMPQGG
jgi:hypothetical protein